MPPQQFPLIHEPAAYIAAILVVLLLPAVWWIRRQLRRKSSKLDEGVPPPELLPPEAPAPPTTGPQLFLNGVRVRAAIVVVAPVGRGSILPPVEVLPGLLDQLAPGFAGVLTSHAARIKLWPPQLSVNGFAQAFFTHFRLPGDRGKGTPWCAVAGKFEAGGRPLLLGVVLSAAAPNSLSQTVVEHAGEWPRLLEVREPR